MAVIVPNMDSNDGAQFGIEGERTLFGVGENFEIGDIFVVTDGDVYSASVKIIDRDGKSAGSVSPSSITNSMFNNDPKQQIKGTVPTKPGDYRLSVEFQMTSDSDGEKFTRTYPVRIVEPIVLTVSINNTSNVDVVLDFMFVIDGVEMEIKNENVSIKALESTPVTYNWVVDNPSSGKHTFELKAVGQDNINRLDVEGLDSEFTFYVGQDTYGWLTIIMVILLVILAIFALWVIRKPIKNYGKPKGRR